MKNNEKQEVEDYLEELRFCEKADNIIKKYCLNKEFLIMYWYHKHLGMPELSIAVSQGVGLNTLYFYRQQLQRMSEAEFTMIKIHLRSIFAMRGLL